nr:ATP-binding protein [Streptomyces sp. 891-h]
MSELVSNRIRTTAGKLGLPHLAETVNEYAQRADDAKMGYCDFLDLVLTEELVIRDDRRLSEGLRLSKLPPSSPTLDPRNATTGGSSAVVRSMAVRSTPRATMARWCGLGHLGW